MTAFRPPDALQSEADSRADCRIPVLGFGRRPGLFRIARDGAICRGEAVGQAAVDAADHDAGVKVHSFVRLTG